MDSGDAVGTSAGWVLPGYRHERELGSGATGRVVLARHVETGVAVAIKYLVRSLETAGDFRVAYRNEAGLLGELRSPHVAQLYEYVESDQGSAIVMELVEGLSLRALLREEGATTPEAALVVLKGSLLGLAVAHGAGVVHRDYKPENVMVTPEGLSKLLDFGIAARSGATPVAAGTPLYMAPEQFTGQPATPATDVYAATATFFECITGAKPYSGTTVLELMMQHTQAPIPDELAPEPVRALIRAGLAKTPGERPESAAVFVHELEAAARGAYGEDWEERGQRKLATLIAMLPLLLLRSPQETPSGTTASARTVLGSGRPGARRATKALAGVTAALLLVGGVAAVALAAGTSHRRTEARSSRATSSATTSLSASGTPTPGVLAAATASVTTTASPTQTPSASPSAPAPETTQPSATPTPTPRTSTAKPTPTATPSTSATPTPTPVLRVISVAITSYTCQPSGTTAVVDVNTDGAATGTMYLTWYYSDSNGSSGTTASTVPVTLPQGKTTVDGTYSFDFAAVGAGGAGYWGLSVSTDPAAIRGNGTYRTVFAPNCQIQ